jgi:hydroxyacylglutathione hydrolase
MRIAKSCLPMVSLALILTFYPLFSASTETVYADKELAAALAKFRSAFSSFEEGRKLFARGDSAGAVRCFQRCTDSLPQHIYAHYYVANILFLQQDYAGALQAIEKADASIDFMMAVDAFSQREKSKEYEKIEKSIDDYYESTTSCRERRELEQMHDQVEVDQDRMKRQAEQGRLRWQELRSHYAYLHGNILFQLREYGRADELYRKAIREYRLNGYAYNNIAAIRYLAHHFEEADEFLKEAEAAGIGDMINLKLKKLVLEALGKPAEGILEQEYGTEPEAKIRVARFTGNVYEGEPNKPHLFAHCYIVFDRESRDALLIDPVRIDSRIDSYIKENNLNVRLILNTHGHFDHAHGNVYYAHKLGVQIAAHSQEAPLYAASLDAQCGKPEVKLTARPIQVGTINVQVYHTPGHTPGSACFLIGPFLVSGDSLFIDGIGKIEAKDDADYKKKRAALVQSLKTIVQALPSETRILPGHGQSDTLSQAKKINPSLHGS